MGRFLGHGAEYDKGTPSVQKIMLGQATGGIIAGASASCITTPLDTIKTRLQVCITFGDNVSFSCLLHCSL